MLLGCIQLMGRVHLACSLGTEKLHPCGSGIQRWGKAAKAVFGGSDTEDLRELLPPLCGLRVGSKPKSPSSVKRQGLVCVWWWRWRSWLGKGCSGTVDLSLPLVDRNRISAAASVLQVLTWRFTYFQVQFCILNYRSHLLRVSPREKSWSVELSNSVPGRTWDLLGSLSVNPILTQCVPS